MYQSETDQRSFFFPLWVPLQVGDRVEARLGQRGDASQDYAYCWAPGTVKALESDDRVRVTIDVQYNDPARFFSEAVVSRGALRKV